LTNAERDQMLRAVWGDESRIKKHAAGCWLEHSVACFGCGKRVTDPQRTKTQIRRQLHKDGWRVAVPYLRRRTVDFCCPACMRPYVRMVERAAMLKKLTKQ
jgi:hypothetical protein